MIPPPSEFIRGFFVFITYESLSLLVSTAPLPLVIIIQYPQTASPKEETAHYSLPDNMFQMEFFLILLDEESY